jgi:hypothetical protein
MPEPSNQSFNPNFNKELNIESIISAPLVAASKANVFMVTGQTRFLLDYCFNQKKEDSDTSYEPVMVEMSMRRGVVNPDKKPDDPDYINLVEMTFSVPLLCLVPLNSLVIDKVTVDFDMEITSVTSYDSNHGIIDKQAQLNGRICRSSTDPSNSNKNNRQESSKLKVNINAGPLPLPVGVLAILDLYTKSIQPIPKEDKQIENPKK